ncbi:hypothetical protein ACFS5J_03100 [Flavobacterium chuncheonense]|uniref:Uncharacterized protein n=1 Tax=Flavobacterium chuncheonense TaxID=2026653 RepID=A0ABW5YIV3_9FLAO
MELTTKEIFGLLHGIVLGSLFLLSFGASFVWLRSYNQELLSEEGRIIRNKRMQAVIWFLALMCWFTVISGTFITYPWYRAVPKEGDLLINYPQALLKASKNTSSWHSFGMEWKEHIGWLSPFIFTAVAYIASMSGETIAKNEYLRKALMLLLSLAFISVAVAALLGALITKKAPII